MSDYQVERITWEDAYTEDQSSWKDIGSIKVEPTVIVSVGYLIKEGKKGVLIAMDLDAEEDSCHAYSFIPKSVIIQREILVPARPETAA